jgi:hypothetical protein
MLQTMAMMARKAVLLTSSAKLKLKPKATDGNRACTFVMSA